MGLADRPSVRRMRPSDLGQVMELERATFRTPWCREVFENEMEAPGRCYLVAEHSDRVVGYGGLMVVDDDAHVNTLAALRPSPVPAIGTRLMLSLVNRGLESGAQHLSLEVRASNRRAQEFYRKFGMAPVGVRKHYYQDDDALIMWVHDIGGLEYRHRLDRIREALP
ncbi:MAG: ribosomal protein S18-alanine N-acetyltransferase [bacterium]|nr:ribosomal protein S18-alanine N-acetyltransferase [bacterium]